MYELKMMIVMRKDLNLRKGKMVAQGAHAAILGMTEVVDYGIGRERLARITEWIATGMAKICVGVDSLEQFEDIGKRAQVAGLEVHTVTDAGYTEFHGIPTVTCMAIGPNLVSQIDVITGDLKLL